MANKHVYLNNARNERSGFNRRRGFDREEETQEQEEPKTIKEFQVAGLRSNYTRFTQSYDSRYAKRTIEFPSYIDLVEIQFFPIFNEDLKKKFYQRYGLLPLSYMDFNRTVIFEIADSDLFEIFKSDIEFIISHTQDVPYSGEDHNLIANIYEFYFIDKRSATSEEAGIIISTIQSANEVATVQKDRLKNYFSEQGLTYSTNDNQDIFYLEEINSDTIKIIEENFDIVSTITTSRPLTARPGTFGTLRTEYGFTVNIPENLTTVGIIDTGVNAIPPFQGLIANDTINITQEIDDDHSGHGTLVAGLAIFGSELPASVQSSYTAKCKVLPIKVLHNNTGGIDFPKLLDAIRQAHDEEGVRIFNMSLAFSPKKYNESYSDFAFELDRLSHELGILIFIAVGNFDSISLRGLLTNDYHRDHDYPDFFYKPDSTSPVHSCENTNICTPSDSLNNVSVGALAGNVEEGDNSDITEANIYPAYYTRKFHFDYERKINSTDLTPKQKNKYLNKPDLVFDGGDLFNQDSGMEILTNPGDFFTRTCGTSLSAPIVASLAAEIAYTYPDLSTQSIKALLINRASYYKPRQLPLFQNKEVLLRSLIGFGIPDKSQLLESDDNSITLVIEDQIKPLEIISLPIYLPEYLKRAGNKLLFDITLAFSFFPDKGNHLAYQPLHISFNLMKNISINDIATKKAEETTAKKGFSWSEDHFGKENILFSNTQHKQYRLQPRDFEILNGEMAIAVRCLAKDSISDGLKTYLNENRHKFSIVIKITEELKNTTEHNLYSEMLEINNMLVIGDAGLEDDITLEGEN